MLQFLAIVILLDIVAGFQQLNCPENDRRFEKIIGFGPSKSISPSLLYRNDAKNIPITTECITRCRENIECRSFLLLYNESTCLWYRTHNHKEVMVANENSDTNVAWFVKTCLNGVRFLYPSADIPAFCGNWCIAKSLWAEGHSNGPGLICLKRVKESVKDKALTLSLKYCDGRLWTMDRIPGATLIGRDTKKLVKLLTRNECQQFCLNETDFICRSMKFKITKISQESYELTKGICVLSDTDRFHSPYSFRVSSYDEEYFENQCTSLQQHGRLEEFCPYEEYENVTLKQPDLIYTNTTSEECQNMCDNNKPFKCRSFSTTGSVLCTIHSENTKVQGIKMLENNTAWKYYEKVHCINITVACNETHMLVKYLPETYFMGRIYMRGYSERPGCFSPGSGTNPVTLKLSLMPYTCGIVKAFTSNNRTLMTGLMILQYNPLIQTQADRIIKIGCISDADAKVLVGTGVTLASDTGGNPSVLINSSKAPGPLVQMRIIDPQSQQELGNAQIGQELQLIIELKPPNASIDIWAGHLVAMTEKGDESILLLDDRGCATNRNIFPTLTKRSTNETQALISTFQAFKFASSSIVRFSVIVQFCLESCPMSKCNEYERKKRKSTKEKSVTATRSKPGNTSELNTHIFKEIPLESAIAVKILKPTTSQLLSQTNKISVASYDYDTDEICLDYFFFLGLVLLWIAILIIGIVTSSLIIRHYRREYKRQVLKNLNANFGFKEPKSRT